ncbi:hypothetical protein I7I50_09104 [Histoplasma capsulatum G186AR]|uniref:Uncharacterized protein n=1 Tax=Ajellomyces capsulatus TaxID=5037 RepID=A0A8H7YTR6_AJECA|nr:hypothetical protein I7I52_06623 [Histoplasma capsulatum]QSS74074.1 hypothetical protein I7I50_09104 [Histoplasma capsulatum G186AR]
MAYYILHAWPVSTASDCGAIRRGSGSAQSSYALEYDLCFCWLSLVWAIWRMNFSRRAEKPKSPRGLHEWKILGQQFDASF